ncbi:4'-phosphopantetheinyl transferase family protein [Aliiroseovarius sp. 2305UL8-7]|uniref:4'-phosphopantetheinyl transferase family protein n=1 Tax=Aliiroseovarius conchicola TaxID=3121637 RepID=UPI003527E3BE
MLQPFLPPSIKVLECHIGDDRQIRLIEAEQVLSSDEIARANRFRFDRDREHFIRARAFLRNSLAIETGHGAAQLSFTYGPLGKPELVSSGVEFNLSHSQDTAVIAVSSSGPVGIDVERIDRSVAVSDVAKVCMTPREQNVLQDLLPNKRCERFFDFWTAKEARMKLTGEGMSLSPTSISLQLTDGRPTGYDTPQLLGAQLAYIPLSDVRARCCVCYTCN